MYKNNIAEILKRTTLFIVTAIIIASLTGCSNNNNDGNLKSKVSDEMEYVESKIITIANQLNNISVDNYKIISEEINTKSKNDESSSSGDSGSGGDSENSGGSNKSSDGKSDGQSQDGSESKNTKTYKTVYNNILSDNKEPKWNTIKEEIQVLEETWGTVTLDLYKIGENNEDIISFSNDLNSAIINISKENKKESLDSMSKLYSYFTKYVDTYASDDLTKNKVNVKYNILNAYVLIEQEKWDEIKTSIDKAEQEYMSIINNVDNNKQYNINKGYILLKEFRNAVDTKDKNVLYIKYKNLIEEINVL